MVGVAQGQVVWVSFPEPAGRRPAVVMQGDAFNASALQTTLVVPLTTNERLAQMPGNVRITSRQSGLKKTSIANVTQLQAVPKASIMASTGHIPPSKMRELWSGINLVFGSPFKPEVG